MALYLNITPFEVEKLTEDCTKAAKNMHSLAMPTWGVKSAVVSLRTGHGGMPNVLRTD